MTPRKGPPDKDQPRSGPPGAYAAPPPTGVVEGPSQGIEFGGISLTFPELTIGIPRLRLHGVKQFRRDSSMHLDSARAPYVATPYAAPMVYGGSYEKRPGDESREKDQPRSDKFDSPRYDQPPPTPRSSDCNCAKNPAPVQKLMHHDLEEQVRELRQKLAQQTLDVQHSMTALEDLTRRANTLREAPVPVITEDHTVPPQPTPEDGAGNFQLRPLPATDQEMANPAVSRTAFLRPVQSGPAAPLVRLRRLPPVEPVNHRTPPRLFEP